MPRILITGGAGFIGSHTCVTLLESGHDLIVLDNFSNSSPEVIERIKRISFPHEHDSAQRLTVIQGDVRDQSEVNQAFTNAKSESRPIEAVIHFAGLKAVGESVEDPLRYWDVNVSGSNTLLTTMRRHNCKVIVFSSTSTVYGEPNHFPLVETTQTAPIHPYAQTKLAVEQMILALGHTHDWRTANLRYFNPVGAHPSGHIGEDPLGVPNNLFPYITQIAAGRRKKLLVFGNDYPTPDGTGIRDYLHVMDLAEAHVITVNHLLNQTPPIQLTLNLGTGRGLSVLDIIQGFEQATGIPIPYDIVARRPGDVPKLEASPKMAKAVLNWTAKRSLEDMCRDGWAWQSANPFGYQAHD